MRPPDEDSRPVVTRGHAGEAPRVELREISGHTTIVTLVGEHDLFTEPSLREQLEHARMASIVIVDLTRCTFMDSMIMAALLGARHAKGLARRIDLVLPAPGTVASRALHLTGVPEFFENYATLEAALANAQVASARV
jgi:anti-anti-sigma factor